jgi:DNA invertase Pin-like site-specific DNA recombinase
MLGKLAPGDVVMVTRIDRLARSTFDLFAIVKRIADAKAQFRSLAEPWADTGTSTGRLMLAVLGGLADVERDLIRTRTAEGRSRAKGSRKAHGPSPFPDTGPTERGHQTARAGRYARRTRSQLQCQPRHDFTPCRLMRREAVVSNHWLITIRLYERIGDIGSTGSYLSAYTSATASRAPIVSAAS